MAIEFLRLLTVFLAYPVVLSVKAFLISHGRVEGDSTLFWAALLVTVPIMLVYLVIGDLVPRSYASLHAHRVALALYRLVRATSFALWLPSWGVVAIAGLVTARFGGNASFNMPNQAEEEIKNLVESAQETGEIEVDEKELLHSVFEFTDTVAREVMTPRVDVDSMPVRSDAADVVKVIHETGHSRIPLYEDTDDQIVGVIHAKDLLMAVLSAPQGSRVSLRSLMRPALFVPENKNLHELLGEMRGNRNHLVVVQDEFGGTAGIVTIEDIVEELVGDIVDEYDVEGPEVVPEGNGFIIEGKTHLDDVNSEVGSSFETEDFDTIGGYVFGLFGRQPDAGESISIDGYRFIVTDTDGRRIVKLRVEATDVDRAFDSD